MDYKKVIENILEVYNLNAAEFAEKIDVQRSSISHILSGRNNPSLDFLLKVKENFPELRWEYLMLKKLPMYEIENKVIMSKKMENNPILPSLFDDIPYESVSEDEISPNTSVKNVEKQEEKRDTPTLPPKQESQEQNAIATKKEKQITRVICFYDDGSFESFEPSL
ncbi:XRE family transcriptional regulator [Ornithobacterium rhinotracheale]|uniref:XRE family transcriptional regulator n=1 Tax=Ornithobacterium rhinotracheale TaxID=28251 RepID=A0A410JRZ3_ORNRH|nr:helix-turn-helix transcriptional regulator [Ornithobacterium rhinotracheale]QAR30925.1 XRE family transcriptional regulator [Ornithobacterium rhinotracheale]